MLIGAERVLFAGALHTGSTIEIDAKGNVAGLAASGPNAHNLTGRAVLPGFVNAHSHAFQRLLRGRTHIASANGDNFWTWRNAKYRLASKLSPQQLYVVSRHAFIEMLLAGVTSVGEFHYVHHRPDGSPYADHAELSEAIVRAAHDAGIRLCLLRVVYLRGDVDAVPNELQRRFCDPTLELACERIDDLRARLVDKPNVTFGVAPHSIRGVPIEAVAALKERYRALPFHVHASEQPKEVERCLAAYGKKPIALLAAHGVLDARTTLVHATHADLEEIDAVAKSGAAVCACPSTEADLGDGLGPMNELHERGVRIALGSDGQTLTSILAEARRVEMHERLRLQRRNVLGKAGDDIAQTLLTLATKHGAQALGLATGELAPGLAADLVSFDLDDPAIADADDASLLGALLFSGDTRAVRDVMVQGKFIVRDGVHPLAQESAVAVRQVARDVFA